MNLKLRLCLTSLRIFVVEAAHFRTSNSVTEAENQHVFNVICWVTGCRGSFKSATCGKKARGQKSIVFRLPNWQRLFVWDEDLRLYVYCSQEMKVNWATSPGNQPKQDTSSEYRIFTFSCNTWNTEFSDYLETVTSGWVELCRVDPSASYHSCFRENLGRWYYLE